MTWAAFERSSYQAARNWDMQPSEFWSLPLQDFWAELDSKIEEARKVREMAEGMNTGKPSGRVFSKAEWDAARRKHQEKMKNDRTSST